MEDNKPKRRRRQQLTFCFAAPLLVKRRIPRGWRKNRRPIRQLSFLFGRHSRKRGSVLLLDKHPPAATINHLSPGLSISSRRPNQSIYCLRLGTGDLAPSDIATFSLGFSFRRKKMLLLFFPDVLRESPSSQVPYTSNPSPNLSPDHIDECIYHKKKKEGRERDTHTFPPPSTSLAICIVV